jgi:hypothetical protein
MRSPARLLLPLPLLPPLLLRCSPACLLPWPLPLLLPPLPPPLPLLLPLPRPPADWRSLQDEVDNNNQSL